MEDRDSDRELQEKLVLYRVLEDKLGNLLNQQNAIANKVLEIQGTLESIDELGAGTGSVGAKEVLFPIGSSAYLKGSVMDDKTLVVEVGSQVAVEKSIGDGRSLLESQKRELQNGMESCQLEVQKISAAMQKIESEAQDLFKRSQMEKTKPAHNHAGPG